jgi:cyclophilin family peptidyl-prolyl cis-trans isomerase
LKAFSIVLVLSLIMFGGQRVLAQAEAQTPSALCAAALPAAEPSERSFESATRVTEPGIDYGAVFCTDAGAIYIDLLEDYTPLTVNNFVFLAEQGFYNNTTFHRVIQDFMAQGGDPTGTGMGGPGYQFADEPVPFLTFGNEGWLAMANSGANTNGSQFFITTAATPHLDYRHTIFGKVLDGQDTVLSIRLRDPQADTQPGTALQTVIITRDPLAIDSTYVVPEPSTTSSSEIADAIAEINSQLPEGVVIGEGSGNILSTDQVIEGAPEGERAAFGEYLQTYQHQYRIAHSIETTTCDLTTVPFMAVSATVDAFASQADASAALQDAYANTTPTFNGYAQAEQPITLDNGLFTKTATVCDQEATHALTMMQRGRFIMTVEIIVPLESELSPDQWLIQLAALRVYDSLLMELFRREV